MIIWLSQDSKGVAAFCEELFSSDGQDHRPPKTTDSNEFDYNPIDHSDPGDLASANGYCLYLSRWN